MSVWLTDQHGMRLEGRRIQVAKNVSYTGGFLDMLASLAVRVLPTVLTGVYSLVVLAEVAQG